MTTDTKALRERLREWAQNEEMVDQYLTAHGHDCIEAADAIDRLEAERERYKAALAELVACEDLKDQADYNLLYAQTTGSLEKGKELTLEYRTRKGPAWTAARAAQKPPNPPSPSREKVIAVADAMRNAFEKDMGHWPPLGWTPVAFDAARSEYERGKK